MCDILYSGLHLKAVGRHEEFPKGEEKKLDLHSTKRTQVAEDAV